MEIAREGVTILLNDIWHRIVVNVGCVSSTIFRIKVKFSRVKVCVVVGYGPNERDGELRNSVGNGYRLWILGDLNGWIGDRTRTGITDSFGVPRANEIGRRVDCVWVTYIVLEGDE